MTPVESDREVIRCDKCGLTQFATGNGLCRKCHAPFIGVEPAKPVPPPQPEPERPAFSVANPLKRLRKTQHLSQRQLAEKMGVPRTYISKIERGFVHPTLSSLARFAEAFGVTMADVIEDERGLRAKQEAEILAEPFLAEIAEALPRLSRTDRGIVLAQVQKYAAVNISAARFRRPTQAANF